MYEKKRFLVETVFEKARNELPKGNKSSISSYLSSLFEERYEFSRDERSYVRYYKSLVEENTDYNIDDLALDYLSKYIGYQNFNDFCNKINVNGGDGTTTFTASFGDIISEKLLQIIVTVSNNPTFTLPDFVKKNGLGIVEMAFVIFLVTGGVVFSNGKRNESGLTNPLGIMFGGKPDVEKDYMYWNGNRYVATDNGDLGPQFKVVAMNQHDFKHFKRIMRPDTLTVDNSSGKVWYEKKNNSVEFFTSFGINPESGKTVKEATDYMINTHAGLPIDTLAIEE